MWVLETAAVAFGLYSALPMPAFKWNEQNMRYALAAFPLVGAALALALWGWTALCAFFALPPLLRGAGLCVLPALVTGGIHLDGYADVSDALASRASPARKREILRDPHCGAFAVIRLCVYYVVFFALCCAFDPTARALRCLGLGFVLSRALSGLALTLLPVKNQPGTLLKLWLAAVDVSVVVDSLTVLQTQFGQHVQRLCILMMKSVHTVSLITTLKLQQFTRISLASRLDTSLTNCCIPLTRNWICIDKAF